MSTNIRGLLIPTQQSFPEGSTNPKDAAFITQKNNIIAQSSLIKSVKGGAIPVPQFQMQYTPVGGPGQTPNDIITKLSQISTQNEANNVYDGCVGKSVCGGLQGGKKRTTKHNLRKKTSKKATKTGKTGKRKTRRNTIKKSKKQNRK